MVAVCLLGIGQSFGAWNGTDMEPATKVDGYYIIDTEAKLAWFANESNLKSRSEFKDSLKLTADLDMGGKLWTPICAGIGGEYKVNGTVLWRYPICSGTFDGGGHSISNIYISAEELIATHKLNDENDNNYAQNLGFIGSFKGTVKNLNLVNIEVHGYGKGGLGVSNNLVDKPISIGTIVGWQSGGASLIDGCTASGVVLTSGDGQAVGGIVGNVGGGKITNCMSTVSIKASGLAFVGGIAGYTKQYQGGSVEVSSCVYAGTELSAEDPKTVKLNGVTYSSDAGAIVGHQYQGKVTFSDLYYDVDLFDKGVGTTTGGTTNGTTTGVPDVNSVDVICPLNHGEIVGGECDKDYPWSVGENTISLNGSDGFTVTFDAKSGEFPDGAKKQKIILKDRIITSEEISTPVHADSAFAGWSLNPEATEPDADLGMISGATTVYAVWYPIYTITFSAAPGTYTDGETVEKTVKVAKGDIISVTGIGVPTTYVKNGTTLYFTGWSDTQKEFEANYEITASDTLHLDGITATGNMIFYAAWTKAKTFTVTYDAHGHGKTKVDFVNVEKGQTLTEPPAPTPDNGYEYSGWCLDTTECDKNHHFDFETKIDKNDTLYADWNAVEYKIVYNLNGGTNSALNPAKFTIESANIVFQAPVKEGYNFKGWFYDENFAESAKQITAGSTGDKTVYAKWEEKKYEISYMAGSGVLGSISPAIKRHGVSITLAEGGHYTLEGYSQDGWATEDGGKWVYALGGTYSIDADVTLYPHWVEGNVEVASYGALTVYTYAENNVEAVINGEYNGSDAVEITGDGITVNSVTLDRTFSVGAISTLYLPFNIDVADVGGATVYKFKTIEKSEADGRWKFKVSRAENIVANTPYIILPSATQVTFNATSLTLNTSNPVAPSEGKWEFRGTYEYMTFAETSEDAYYVFAAQNIGGTKLGEFVKSSGYANPMRAYLIYHKNAVAAKSINGNLGGSIPLPNEIDIEVENEKGIVVETGTFNTVTGAVRMDCWFDLKGRRLNSKPTVKGTYYKNGKKVIVK